MERQDKIAIGGALTLIGLLGWLLAASVKANLDICDMFFSDIPRWTCAMSDRLKVLR